PALDPSSTGPLGTRALVLLLESFGAEVSLTGDAPGAGTGTALLLVDDLGAERFDALTRWVRAGGTLLVADPRSRLAPPAEGRSTPLFGTGSSSTTLVRACGLPALGQVERVDPSGGLSLRLPDDGVGCFPSPPGYFLVARPLDRGTVVAVGGAAMFVNSRIGRAGNAALAVSLLAPRRGTPVAFLRPPPPGGGRETLRDLVRSSIKWGLVQLGVAFVLLALWRARRMGRPVAEPQPVPVAGSDLVVAVGHLLQLARNLDQAAAMLRADLRRTLCDRLGLPAEAPAEALAAAASAHSAVLSARLAHTLSDRAVPDEGALVDLAQSVEAARREVVDVRR
ncbi:MAG: DUF4350 domain-containing protein, partial [Acidimicrobiales bacterium]